MNGISGHFFLQYDLAQARTSVFQIPYGDGALLDTGIVVYVTSGKGARSQDTLSLGNDIGICGDFNSDDQINIVDLTGLVGFLFGGLGSPRPLCQMDIAGLSDGPPYGDGRVNICDLTALVNYLYGGGLAPGDDCCDPPWDDWNLDSP